MIDPKELRIGNWAHHGKNWSYRHDNGKPFDFQWNESDWYAVGESTMDLDENIFPIPLTPEWLERLGFEKINHRIDGIIYKKSWLRIPSLISGVDWRGGYITKERVQYVHQLQNLFFALTGEEL